MRRLLPQRDRHPMTTHTVPRPSRRRIAHAAGIALLALAAAGGTSVFTAPDAEAATLYNRFELSVDRWAINTGFDQGSTVNGANAQIWSWAHRDPHDWNSQWRATPKPGGYYEYRNRWSNQCLDVEGTYYGAALEQQPCDNTESQRWKSKYTTGSQYVGLVNKWASRVRGREMVATSYGTSMGSAVKLWDWYAGVDQQWYGNIVKVN